MKILKIFGVVVAVHAAVFMFVFAIPGCRTTTRPTPQEPAPDAGTPAPSVSYPGAPTEAAPVAGTETPAPEGAPMVSFNSQHYNPTRPGTSAAGMLQNSEVTGVTPASTYKVQPNDSLWKVAKKFGIGSDDLAAANHLKQGAPLKVGQKLIIPGKVAKAGAVGSSGTRTYTVKSGDSLGTIARKQGTTVADIRSLNPEIKNDSVRVGQEITLPASGKSAAAAAATVSATPVVSNTAVSAPEGSVPYIVQPGDGINSISKKFGVPAKEICFQNNITDPKNLRVGQKLVIPGVKTPGVTAPSVTVPSVEQVPVGPVAPVETPVSPASAPEASPVTPSEAPPVVKVEESSPVAPVVPAP